MSSQSENSCAADVLTSPASRTDAWLSPPCSIPLCFLDVNAVPGKLVYSSGIRVGGRLEHCYFPLQIHVVVAKPSSVPVITCHLCHLLQQPRPACCRKCQPLLSIRMARRSQNTSRQRGALMPWKRCAGAFSAGHWQNSSIRCGEGGCLCPVSQLKACCVLPPTACCGRACHLLQAAASCLRRPLILLPCVPQSAHEFSERYQLSLTFAMQVRAMVQQHTGTPQPSH